MGNPGKKEAPLAGDILSAGTTYDVAWSDSRKYDEVDIEYSDGSRWDWRPGSLSVRLPGTGDI